MSLVAEVAASLGIQVTLLVIAQKKFPLHFDQGGCGAR